MAFDQHKNFAYSTVATAPSPPAAGTTLVLQSGGGSNFPATPFNAVVWPTNAQPLASNAEIVRVTSITRDTLTIVRAQEGTIARVIRTNDQISAAITAKTFTDVESKVTSVVDIEQGVYATMFDALQAAVDNIRLTDYTELRLPAGLVDLDKAGNTQRGVQLPANITGQLTIRGHRKGTLLKLSTNTKAAFQQGAMATNDTLRNITISGIVVDANSAATANFIGVVADFTVRDGNVSNITIEDIETINVGNLSGTNGRRNINITITTTTAFDTANQYSLTDINIRRWRFGFAGGGSNTGILVSAFASPAAANNNYYSATVTKANVWLDRITIEDGAWTAGALPTTGYVSAGVQVGGDGLAGTVNVRRVSAYNSGDVNFEFDSVLDLNVERCVGVDGVNESFFLANNHGGLPAVYLAQQVARFSKCVARRTVDTTSSGAGFMLQAKHGTAFGHVLFDDCSFEHLGRSFSTGTGGFINPNNPIVLMGAFRKVSIRNMRVSYPNLSLLATANNQTISNVGVIVQQHGGQGVLEVKGLHFEANGTADASTFTGCTFQASALRLDAMSRLALDVDGITVRTSLQRFNGYIIRLRELELATSGFNLTDTFATAGTLAGDYIVDFGSLSDLQQGSGLVSSVANHTTRKLFRAPMLSAVGSTRDQIGEVQDGGAYTQALVPAGGSAGMELIARLKVSADGQSGIHAVFDGTAQTMRIEKVVSNTPTVLVGPTAVGGATAGTTVGVRLLEVGNVLTADWFTGSSRPSVTTAGTTTITATLTGSDIATFGATGPIGQVGFGWTPGAPDGQLFAFRHDRLGVCTGGTARGLRALGNAYTPSAGNGLLNNTSTGQLRFESPLNVMFHRSGVARDGSGVQTDISLGTDANVTDFVRVQQNSGWAFPPAGGAITVTASPFTYKNTKAYPQRVAFYGGTVSSVVINDAAGNSQQIASSTGVTMVLQPGESTVVTHSSTPTGRQIPLL